MSNSRQVTQTTKDSTYAGFTKEKRKRRTKAEMEADQAPTEALSVVTAEDLALDRELEQMARETPLEVSEGSSENILRVERDEKELLSDVVEGYKPANSLITLDSQVQQAKMSGCDSIEATDAVIEHFCGKNYGEPHYFVYRDIKVYRVGKSEVSKQADGVTMEQKLFGKARK